MSEYQNEEGLANQEALAAAANYRPDHNPHISHDDDHYHHGDGYDDEAFVPYVLPYLFQPPYYPYAYYPYQPYYPPYPPYYAYPFTPYGPY